MFKRIMLFLFFLLILTYLGFAVTTFNKKPSMTTCRGVLFAIVDTTDYGFVGKQEIVDMLKGGALYPVGRELRDVDTRRIEQFVAHHPFVEKAECYLTSGHDLSIQVTQRVPVLHIMNGNGREYYVDDKGKIMHIHERVVDVPVVTGNFNEKYACSVLLPLGQYLARDRFWNAQIEQIHVTPKGELDLVPRVGDQILQIGEPKQLEEKFNKLFLFYNQALNEVGWNKYDTINIEFLNQIICTKKQTKI